MCPIVKHAQVMNNVKHLPQCSTISLPGWLQPYCKLDSNLENLNGQDS
jgi:hypothetical protein